MSIYSKCAKSFLTINFKNIFKNSKKKITNQMSSEDLLNLVEKGKKISAWKAIDENIDHVRVFNSTNKLII